MLSKHHRVAGKLAGAAFSVVCCFGIRWRGTIWKPPRVLVQHRFDGRAALPGSARQPTGSDLNFPASILANQQAGDEPQ
jgi:hypothetical protein